MLVVEGADNHAGNPDSWIIQPASIGYEQQSVGVVS